MALARQLPTLEAAQPLTPYVATIGGKPTGGSSGVGIVEDQSQEAGPEGAPLSKLREWFRAYQDNKQPEMDESREARRYYHGDQWTTKERETLADRNQPAITINRVGRKLNGLVGLCERLRQDPKAYPRTPQHVAGADLATAVLRFVMDQNQWPELTRKVSYDLCCSGIGGVEFDTEPTDDQSEDVTIATVEPETFFYDPRSIKADFSDARFLGVAKWMDLDAAIELFPDQAESLKGSMATYGRDGDAQGLRDWEKKWFDSRLNRALIIHTCYRWDGQWFECVHTGYNKLAGGPSRFKDEKGKSLCRFRMVSCNVDQDGDRYGFVRNLKGPQDEINHKRSKFNHFINVDQIIYTDGMVDDIEKTRKEAKRPDGTIKISPDPNGRFEFRNMQIQMQGQAELLKLAQDEIEAFGGVNPALAGGQGQENRSGRAIALMQQAGIAEAGPFLGAFRSWKLSSYRMSWNIIRTTWKTPRFIRITDNPQEIQMVMVNQPQMNAYGLPALGPDGQPALVNAIGQLDVDIILDEGPDTVTLREDVLNDVKDMVAAKMLPPQAYLALANLPPDVKSVIDAAIQPQQPDPNAEVRDKLEIANATATIRGTNARAAKDEAAAVKTQVDTHLDAQIKPAAAMVDMQSRMREPQPV